MLSKRWIFALIVVSVGVFVHKRLSYSPVYKIEKRLDGKVVVITGGNSGIGKAAAIEFAKLGAKVIIASRNLQNTQRAKDEIAKESGNQNVEGYQLDLESFDSVQQFAKKINEQEEFIDFLVNNAGVATVRGLTPQGLSRIFAINHLGHFLLTNMLLEKMLKQSKNNRPVRIINVSSAAYRIKKTIDFDSMLHYNSSSVIEDFTNYGQSKLANVLFTSELDRRYKDAGITSYVLHPGLVSTNIGNDFPDWFKAMTTILMSMYARTSFLGCQTIMYCALDAHVTEYSGSYFEDNAYSPLDEFAKDEKAAIELWNISLNLTGLS